MVSHYLHSKNHVHSACAGAVVFVGFGNWDLIFTKVWLRTDSFVTESYFPPVSYPLTHRKHIYIGLDRTHGMVPAGLGMFQLMSTVRHGQVTVYET